MNRYRALEKLRVILCGPTHQGNVGFVARAMSNMQVNKLYLVNPKSSPDEMALSTAARASRVLREAKIVSSLDEALKGVTLAIGTSARHRNTTPEKRNCREAMQFAACEAEAGGEIALIFGNERNGLSATELGKCHLLAYIPASIEYNSLNLSHAAQIFLYEYFNNTYSSKTEDIRNPDYCRHEEMEFFLTRLHDKMRVSEFLKKGQEGKVKERMQLLFRRARPRKGELDILLGFLGAIR